MLRVMAGSGSRRTVEDSLRLQWRDRAGLSPASAAMTIVRPYGRLLTLSICRSAPCLFQAHFGNFWGMFRNGPRLACADKEISISLENEASTAIRYVRPGRCAAATTGHAIAAPSPTTNPRRLIRSPCPLPMWRRALEGAILSPLAPRQAWETSQSAGHPPHQPEAKGLTAKRSSIRAKSGWAPVWVDGGLS